MIQGLKGSVVSMHHTVKRSDVQEQFSNTLSVLNSDVKQGLKNMNDLVSLDNVKLSDLPEFSSFNKASGINAKDIKSLVAGIDKIITYMEKHSNDISGLIKDELPEYISRDIITVKQATIINVVNNYNNVSLFTLDLLLYLVTLVDVKTTDAELDMVKSKVQEIRINMLQYGKMLNFFKVHKNLGKDIAKLSNDKVLIDGKDGGTLNILSANSFKLDVVGFIGNPIYHVKMWLVDREMAKYENLKEKKKLMELKIMDLKARKAGERNPKLEKAIQHYEDKLAATEYKMRKIEEN